MLPLVYKNTSHKLIRKICVYGHCLYKDPIKGEEWQSLLKDLYEQYESTYINYNISVIQHLTGVTKISDTSMNDAGCKLY